MPRTCCWIIRQYLLITEFIQGIFCKNTLRLCFLPPDLVPKGDLWNGNRENIFAFPFFFPNLSNPRNTYRYSGYKELRDLTFGINSWIRPFKPLFWAPNRVISSPNHTKLRGNGKEYQEIVFLARKSSFQSQNTNMLHSEVKLMIFWI